MSIDRPFIALAATLLTGALTVFAGDKPASAPGGAELYQGACQRCHGIDGRGRAREEVGFDVALPDFTECTFNSREPAADWVAVAHEGGPARAFDRMMPAFGQALTEAELEQVVDHVKSFCDERAHWPPGSLNMPRAFFTSKAFVEDEAVVSTIAHPGDEKAVETKLVYETRIGARGQIEAILPFRFHERPEDGEWTGGNGDMVLATKWVVLHSDRTGSILSGGLEVVMPTGRIDRGTGKEVWLLEPFLAYGQLLPLDGFLQLQVGSELSTEPDRPGHEAFWRLAAGMTFAGNHGFGRAWSPMIEVLGAMEFEDGAAPEWQVAPQLQVSLPVRQHILLSLGALVPVANFEPERIAGMLYLLWDWFDGPLTEGWR